MTNYMRNRYNDDKEFRERLKNIIKKSQKKKYDFRLKNGLCTKCGIKLTEKWKTCKKCRDKCMEKVRNKKEKQNEEI